MKGYLLKIIILLALATSSCGKVRHSNLRALEFVTYLQKFESEAIKRNKHLEINELVIEIVKDLPDSAIGLCEVGGNEPAKISLKRSYWDTASDLDKEQLIFHELGHCVLLRYHDNKSLSNKNPASIMSSYHFSGQIYNGNRTYYLDELFSRGNEWR
jgi:hypothetical protein